MTNSRKVPHAEQHNEILAIISPVFHPLIKEHHELWSLMNRVRNEFDKNLYQNALTQIGIELNQHFQFEEQIILPKLDKYFPSESVGPIAKLKDEHVSIQLKYEEVSQLASENGITADLTSSMNLLAYLLMKHIEKEDHYLFPLISLVLSEDEKNEIEEELENRES